MARAISLLLAATPWLMSGVLADHDVIAGYTPASDVVEHSELDLDMEEIDEKAGLETEAGFAAAYLRYDQGFNRCVRVGDVIVVGLLGDGCGIMIILSS